MNKSILLILITSRVFINILSKDIHFKIKMIKKHLFSCNSSCWFTEIISHWHTYSYEVFNLSFSVTVASKSAIFFTQLASTPWGWGTLFLCQLCSLSWRVMAEPLQSGWTPTPLVHCADQLSPVLWWGNPLSCLFYPVSNPSQTFSWTPCSLSS